MNSDPLVTLRQTFERCSTMDASLGERLEAYSNAVREFIPDYANAVDELVTRLRENGAGDNAPQPGSPMPPFLLPDENGRLVALEDLLRRGPAAITFQRGTGVLGAGLVSQRCRTPRRTLAASARKSLRLYRRRRDMPWSSKVARSRRFRF